MANNKFEIVETEYGPVKGVLTSTALGRNIYDFRAIPYMKASVGKLRFRDAEAPERWNEPLDVTGERPFYFSSNVLLPEVDGHEDAGIVTVSTPYLDRKLPVSGKQCRHVSKMCNYRSFIFKCIYMAEVSRGRMEKWICMVVIICCKRILCT